MIRMLISNNYNLIKLIAIILLGSLFFIGITGGKIIYFSNIDWLFAGTDVIADSEQHYIAWLFFKNTPLIQFPLFKNYHYGMEISSSLIHSDSVPLMAIFFKMFKDLIPHHFQYFGLWIYICFVLQGAFSYLIIKRYTKSFFVIMLTSCFFILAPILTYRLFWSHEALFGQWIVLFAIYNYLNDFSLKKWLTVNFISLLVHPYFFGMVTILFLSASIKESILKNFKPKEIIKKISIYLATSLILQILFGYYAIGLNFMTSGYDFFRANANTFFDPSPGWGISYSRLMPNLDSIMPPQGGDYEGFAFLGIGIFIIFLFLLINFLIKKIKINLTVNTKILIYLSLLFLLYSLSNKIFFGQYEIISFGLPKFTKFITETFRVSGRFIWPVVYLIYIGLFFTLIDNFKIRTVKLILITVLIVQIWDMLPCYQHLREKLVSPALWPGDTRKSNKYNLIDKNWETIGRKYKKLNYVYPYYAPENFTKLAIFASKYKMQINFGYFSRIDKSKANKINKKLENEILNNKLDKEALYYIHDPKVLELVSKKDGIYNLMKLEDKFILIVPQKKSKINP